MAAKERTLFDQILQVNKTKQFNLKRKYTKV